MDIDISKILVMQDQLRHTAQVAGMIDFVMGGGFWTEDVLKAYAHSKNLKRACPLMEIIRFPDGHLMVHDGHHRIVAIYLGERDFLRNDEYVFKDWTYEDYLNINFANKWVTTFDPRDHIRIPDIGNFKKTALDLAATDEKAAIEFIEQNKSSYIRPRNVNGVEDLVDKYVTRTAETFAGLGTNDGTYFRAFE